MAIQLSNIGNVTDGGALQLNGAYFSVNAEIDGTTYLFVAGFFDDGITVFSVAPDGSLTNVFNQDDGGILELNGVTGLETVDVGDRTFLIATGHNDDGLTVFEVNTDGPFSLDFVQVIPDNTLRELDGAHHVTTIEVGGVDYVYISGYDDDGLMVYSVGADGMLTEVQQVQDNGPLEIAGPASTHIATVDGNNFLFVAGFDDDGIGVLQIGNDGMLTPVFNVQDNAQLEIEAVHTLTSAVLDGTTYLFAGGFGDDGISVFSVASNGALTNVFNIMDQTDGALIDGVATLDIAQVNGATYLIAAASGLAELPNEESGEDGLSVFLVNNDGSLSLVDIVPDSDGVELDRVYSAKTLTVNGTSYVIATGRSDDGVAVFDFGEEQVGFTDTGPFTIDENEAEGTTVGDVNAAVGDSPDDQGITYAITGGNTGTDGDSDPAFSIDSSTGIITVNDSGDLDFEDQSAYVLTVEATAGGQTISTNVTINLNDINDAPEIVAPTNLATAEDTPVELTGFDFQDDDGDELTVVLTATGSLFEGSAVPGVAISGLGTDSITLTGLGDDIASVLEDVTLTPPLNFTGTVNIAVTADDDNGGLDADTGVVTVSVGTNAPTFTETGPFDVDENEDDGTAVGDVDATLDGGLPDESITYAIIDGNQDKDGDLTPPFSIDASTGEITVNDGGDLNFEDMSVFTLTVEATNTGTDETSTAQVTIALNDLNDAPEITPNTGLQTPEDNGVLLSGFTVEDQDGDTLIVVLSSPSATFSGSNQPGVVISGLGTDEVTLTGAPADIQAAIGTITYTPPQDFAGLAGLTATADDGNQGTDSVDFTILVTPEGDAPIFTNTGPFPVDENEDDGTSVGDVDAQIGDGVTDENVVYEIIDGNQDKDGDENPPFAIDFTTGEITVNDGGDLDFELMPQFVLTIRATNTNTLETSTTTVTITLTDLNDPPEVTPAVGLTTPEDTAIGLDDFDVDDQDDDVVALTLSSDDGTFTGPVNVLGVSVDGLGTDEITLTGLPDNLDAALDQLDFLPAPDFNGEALISYFADDGFEGEGEGEGEGESGTDSGTTTITVTPVNDDPVVTPPDMLMTNEDVPLPLDGFAVEDVDGDTITLVVSNPTGRFTGVVNTPVNVSGLGTNAVTLVGDADLLDDALAEISFVPPQDFFGTATLSYTATDGAGGEDSGSVDVQVKEVEDVLDARDDSFFVSINGSLSGNVTDNNGFGFDTIGEGSTFTVSLVGSGPSNGNLTLNADGSFTYTPDTAYFCGSGDTFTYRLSDSSGDSDTAQVTIVVGFPDIVMPSEDDFISVFTGTPDKDKFKGTSANDFAEGFDGRDKLKGDDGNDTLKGGASRDKLNGQDGNDTLFGGTGRDFLRGNDGDDLLDGGDDNDSLDGGEGDDIIEGAGGNDRIKAGDGDDAANGGDGNDRLFGRDGDDALLGGAGDDRLTGGKGNDRLSGGTGNDELYGGGDADVFVFNRGDDVDEIFDMDFDEDRIDLSCSDFGIESFAQILAIASKDGKDVLLDFGNGDQLRIDKTDVDELTADAFIF